MAQDMSLKAVSYASCVGRVAPPRKASLVKCPHFRQMLNPVLLVIQNALDSSSSCSPASSPPPPHPTPAKFAELLLSLPIMLIPISCAYHDAWATFFPPSSSLTPTYIVSPSLPSPPLSRQKIFQSLRPAFADDAFPPQPTTIEQLQHLNKLNQYSSLSGAFKLMAA